MARATNHGYEIEYDTFGDPAAPALLLIMGFGAQMTGWDDGFCRLLADRGRHVIRYDNRDVGLSTKSPGPPPDISVLFAPPTDPPPDVAVPYTLSDMAGDGLAVLDQLGIDRAHVVGASMGGMIAQSLAIGHPDRLLTLTSIMSTTGAGDVGQSRPEALGVLLSPAPSGRDAAIARTVELRRVLAGADFDEDRARALATTAYDRSFHPEGAVFQLFAIATAPDRTADLARVTVPTLVIHGEADPLIEVSGGHATAAAVPGARLMVFERMGHDLPVALWPAIVDAIVDHTANAPI